MSTKDCSTTPGAKFKHPIRFNVYQVAQDNEAGRLVGAVTHTYEIPYRPSANYTKCSGSEAGKWFSKRDNSCKNGKAARITAGLGSLDLPDKAIISVEYNTSHYGYEPIGDAPLRLDHGRAVRTTASTLASATATRARPWASRPSARSRARTTPT